MTRLEMAAQDVADKLRMADAAQQRAASLVACELAVQAAPIGDPDVLSAVEQLRKNGRLSNQLIVVLNDLAARLDEQYFTLQDKSEHELSTQIQYINLFGQARAVSALAFAGGEDALMAAMESIYEATATVDDAGGIYDAVLLALAKK